MNKLGILVYDYSLFGGAEHVAANLANELCQFYEVHYISCFNEKKEEAFLLNKLIKKHVLSENTLSMSTHCRFMSKKLNKILINNKIDVLLNITAGVNTLSYIATKRSKIKVIYCEHSNLENKTYGKKHQFRQWLGAKTADRIITLTKIDCEQFKKKYHINNVDYIYNWYDGFTCENYDINSKKIITVGRLEYIKGYDRLIQVANIVMKNHLDWTWDIYGEGTYREKIENDIKKYHLENNVYLKGNDPQILEKYRNYAFTVLTSYYEGFALVLVEAMASSLPAISFNCPTGPAEIIKHGYNGFLIENGNIDEMANRIDLLIKNNDERLMMAKNAPNILSKFNKKQICKQWRREIDSLIAGGDK